MAETPSVKVQYEYQNPNNVECEVPGSQNMREVTEKLPDESTDGAEVQNGGYTVTRRFYTEHSETEEGTKITRTTVTLSSNATNVEQVTEGNTEVVSEKTHEETKPKTKIPKLKFRQAAERVKRERRLTQAVAEGETHIPVPKPSNSKISRISKIPPPTSKPYVIKREVEETIVTKADDEFDKIYEEVVENTQTDIEIKHPEMIEDKFEEIIHDYDENKVQPINVEKIRQSRIPSLRRRTSEHVESKTEKLVLSEKTKTRSLPRLKEISMRVKEDDETLSQMKYSRSISTETATSGGHKSTVETRITRQPGAATKISKVITEYVTKAKDGKNKGVEATESATVHKTTRVTKQGDQSKSKVEKNVSQIKMKSETEDIMKHSVSIGYVSFESNITENNASKQATKEIRQVIENTSDISKSHNITLEENKSVTKQVIRSVSETTNNTESVNSPTIDRSMSVTRVISSSNDKERVKELDSPKSPTVERDNITRTTTERRYVEGENTSSTIERIKTMSRAFSSSNEAKVGNVEDIQRTSDSNGQFKASEDAHLNVIVNENTEQRVISGRKFISQNKSHSIERSENITSSRTSNDRVKKIEHSKSLSYEQDNNDKDTLQPTISKALTKQINENREVITEETGEEGKDTNTESYKMEKSKDEEVTSVRGKVGKLIQRIDSNEVNTETTRRVDDLPKKKSILSKIAMFERQEEDRMPLKKPGNLPKLVIKHPQIKATHLHTPTIVEEVLKSTGTSPVTAQIDDSQKTISFDYNANTESKVNDQTKEIINEVSTVTISNKDQNPEATDEASTFDYKVNADEYNQIVELTKVNTNITEVTRSHEKKSEVKAIQEEKKYTATSEEGIAKDGGKDDNALPYTSDIKFKEVRQLVSNFEKVETSKEAASITVDAKINNLIRPLSVNESNKDSDNQNDGKEQLIADNKISSDDHLKPGSILTMDYKLNVDTDGQGLKLEDKDDKVGPNLIYKKVIPDTPTTFEYTFRDVKKLATEYEQKAKVDKNLDVYSRIETVSPILQNYGPKSSEIDASKLIVDAPVIVITPKRLPEVNTNLNNQDNKVEVATSSIKEATIHTAESTEIKKQTSTEYNQHTIENRNFSTQTSNTFIDTATTLETSRARNINRVKSVEMSEDFNAASNYDIKAVETRNKATYGTQTSNNFKSVISNVDISPIYIVPEEAELKGISTETLTTNTETTKDGSSEVIVKSKGYIIKHDGDLAYAQIQDDNYNDKLGTNEKAPELPKTPPPTSVIEEKKKYYADVDINTVLKGKVSRMISRMTSLEQQTADKKIISVKEMPRKMSVLEKVAMYEVSEKKLSSGQTEYSYVGRARIEGRKEEVHKMTDEEYEERILELKSARLTHGMIENMPHLVLRNGVEMPVIALGTATLDARLIPHIVGAAIDLGYRAVDTAYIYGNEKEVGEAIRAKIADGTVRREDLFIISKLWSTFHRTDLVEKACRSSLEAMGLDYFDLYLIHNPMSFKEGGDAIPKIATVIQYSQFDYLDAWFGMEKLMTKDLVRSIGVSNFNSAQLQRVLDKAKIKPVVNQVECHPYLSQLKLEAFCEDRDIKLSCFGVLGSKGTPSAYKSPVPPVIDDPLVQVMASGLNVSPAQLLISYQLDSGRNAVVKSSSAKHLWDNLQAVTLNLTRGQIDALNALNRNKRIFTFKGMGDTHKNYPFKTAF